MNWKFSAYINVIFVFISVFVLGCQQKPKFSLADDTKQVISILKIIDQYGVDMSVSMDQYSEDVVHMAQGSRAITSKSELRTVLEKEWSYGKTDMQHEIIDLHSYPELVLTRGRVKGTWTPPEGDPIRFETNNVITFRRMQDGSLKIWHVIFNRVALENYP